MNSSKQESRHKRIPISVSTSLPLQVFCRVVLIQKKPVYYFFQMGCHNFKVNALSEDINFVFYKNHLTKGNLFYNVKVFSIDMCCFISGGIFSPWLLNYDFLAW